MGGVLIEFNPERILYSMFDKDTADIALREIFRNRLWAEKDRGIVFPEDIMRIAGDKLPAEHYEKIRELTYNFYPYMKPYPEMEDLVKRLRKNGYGIFLLSNAAADFYDNRKNIPALSYFDGYLISADYHLLKPEKEIYYKLFSKFNLRAEECFFTDDVPANCEGARECGMTAYCHKSGSTDELIGALRKAGVNI